VKYPVAGKVKTRLAKQLSQDAATDLYKSFVTDILATLRSLNVNFKIVFDPPDVEDQFQQWLGKEYRYTPQIGQDLGQRIKNAFLQTFAEGFNNVVTIGSDSPDLPEYFLKRSFQALDTHDAVIGPSSDRGYYLIGFPRDSFLPEVFENISWSNDSVLEQTVDILKQHGRKAYLLPQWHDVDTLADLKSLLHRNKNAAFNKSRTFFYLTTTRLWSDDNV
jgi:rSAM/selenodomain-associated transferase 1